MSTASLSKARHALKKYWGYDSFRSGQEEAISSVLEGKNTLVLFPTGGGKSLCYQVPAMIFDGLTVVLSPLVALMQDQVDQLQKLGIRAAFINSTLPPFEVEQRLVNARNGMYSLLYVAPERLSTELWKAEQDRLNISLIAVDEAHCISEWGHDFRPAYRKIREELEDLGDEVTWIALTATATPEVKKDLLEVLRFHDSVIVTNGFQRENLHWWVTKTEKKRDALKKTVMKASKLGSGIIYSSTRRDCENLAEYFSGKGIQTNAYHAGLSGKVRESVQKKWVDGSIPLVTATNAFGMGIDKADCRYVVHYTMPFSLEAYYQEAGRAGRDGETSYPLLLFKESDADYLKARILKNYPDYETLIQVYNALCDELELAVGSSHESPEAVDYANLAKRSRLTETRILNSLQLLQRLDVIQTFELRVPRVGLMFIISADYLQQFLENTEPAKADFLDTLHRQFGPESFRDFYYLNISVLTEKLGINSNQLRKALKVFSEHDQLLNFKWQAEVKLVQVQQSRMKKLSIDHKQAYHYKEILLKKLDYMVRYAKTRECREVFLRTYFGETDCKPCGNCDNCILGRKGENMFSETDIEHLKQYLGKGKKSVRQILKHTGWHRKKLKQLLMYLQREEVVETAPGENQVYRLRTG